MEIGINQFWIESLSFFFLENEYLKSYFSLNFSNQIDVAGSSQTKLTEIKF
jgi:hypothetical protein